MELPADAEKYPKKKEIEIIITCFIIVFSLSETIDFPNFTGKVTEALQTFQILLTFCDVSMIIGIFSCKRLKIISYWQVTTFYPWQIAGGHSKITNGQFIRHLPLKLFYF